RNTLGGLPGALREALDLVGNGTESASLLAMRGRVDRRIEGEDAGAFGDRPDERDDLPDLLRTLAEALDQLLRVPDEVTRPRHALAGPLDARGGRGVGGDGQRGAAVHAAGELGHAGEGAGRRRQLLRREVHL